jgi:hypothetical protein
VFAFNEDQEERPGLLQVRLTQVATPALHPLMTGGGFARGEPVHVLIRSFELVPQHPETVCHAHAGA